MAGYRLSVVKDGGGHYFVNSYHKSAMERKDELSDVIEYMSQLEQEVLMAEPCYVNFKDDEIKMLERIREIFLSERKY